MRRPGPPIIFLGTFLAMLVMVLMISTVSTVSGAYPETVYQPNAAPPRTAVPEVMATEEPGAEAPVLEPVPEQPALEETSPQEAPAESDPFAQGGGIEVVEPVFTDPSYPAESETDLTAFIQTVADGRAGAIRGVFAPGLFAYPVTNQPGDDVNWVSTDANEVTLFGPPEDYGVIALLAHNTLAGYIFDGLQNGDEVILVYGDGSIDRYRITGAESYQAMQPTSPVSEFYDLASGQMLTSGQLFTRVYTGSYPLVLQTCIEKDGNPKWGRLFLTGEKV